MAQFELIVFAADLELDRPDIARAAAPGNDFLNVRSTHFEIVIKEPSWIDRQAFPAFADVFDCEIREFDFLAGLVFHTRPVRRLLFRCSLSAADWTNESQQAPEHEDKSRIISHEPEVFGVFWNIGSDSSILTRIFVFEPNGFLCADIVAENSTIPGSSRRGDLVSAPSPRRTSMQQS